MTEDSKEIFLPEMGTMAIEKLGNKTYLAVLLLTSASLYAGILFFHYTSDLVTQYTRGQTVNLYILAGTLFFLTIINRRPGRIGIIYNAAVITIVFGVTLTTWFWHNAFSFTTHMWGYLPTSDAQRYYVDSYNFIFFDKLAFAYRPLFNLFLSSLMVIFQFDSRLMIAFMGFLNILGVLIASNQIKQTHGSLAASIFIIASFLGYFFYIGTFMTEQLGFLIGNLSFAMLWQAVHTNNKRLAVISFLALGFGLNVRAGAMVVLITIPLWAAWRYREKKWISWKWLGIFVSLALIGFLVNFSFSKWFVQSDAPLFSNFGYSLYGVARGNLGWTQILEDYPGIAQEDTTRVALEQIRKDPLLFVEGVYRVYVDYFDPGSPYNAMMFLRFSQKTHFLYIFLFIIALFNLLWLIIKRKEALAGFLIFVLGGIFLSVPFAPMKDVGYRSYIVTNPYLITLLFFGFRSSKEFLYNHFIKKYGKGKQEEPAGIDPNSGPILNPPIDPSGLTLAKGVLILLAILTIGMPFLITSINKYGMMSEKTATCPTGQIPVTLWTHHNAWVHMVSDDELYFSNQLPFLAYSTAETLLAQYQLSREYQQVLKFAKPGTSVGWVPANLQSATQNQDNRYLGVVNTQLLPKSVGFLTYCAIEDSDSIPSIHIYRQADLLEAPTSIPANYREPVFRFLGQMMVMVITVFMLLESVYYEFTKRDSRGPG